MRSNGSAESGRPTLDECFFGFFLDRTHVWNDEQLHPRILFSKCRREHLELTIVHESAIPPARFGHEPSGESNSAASEERHRDRELAKRVKVFLRVILHDSVREYSPHAGRTDPDERAIKRTHGGDRRGAPVGECDEAFDLGVIHGDSRVQDCEHLPRSFGSTISHHVSPAR